MPDELKSCPFCGHAPFHRPLPNDGRWITDCNTVSCIRPTTGIRRTEAQAIAAWNSRATLTALRTDGEANMSENITAPVSCTFGEMVEAAQESLTLEKAGICSFTTDGEANSREAGYKEAFYKIAELLDIPAQTISPREVFETQIYPALEAALRNTAAVPSGEAVERAFCNKCGFMGPSSEAQHHNRRDGTPCHYEAAVYPAALSASKPDDASALLKEAYRQGWQDCAEDVLTATHKDAMNEGAQNYLDASIGRDGA